MRFAVVVLLTMQATAAAAHPGHLAEVAGHGHWWGAAALGAAIAIGLWAGLKGRKSGEDAVDDTSDEADDEAQEA